MARTMEDHHLLLRQEKGGGGDGLSTVVDQEPGLKREQHQQRMSEAMGIPGCDRDQTPAQCLC